MNCARIKRLFWDYDAGRLARGETEAVERHCAGCPACARELAEIGKTREILADDEPYRPPEGYWESFWPRLRRGIEAAEESAGERHAAPLEWIFLRRPLVALAGSAVVVLAALYIFNASLFRGRAPGRGAVPPITVRGGDFVVGSEGAARGAADEYILRSAAAPGRSRGGSRVEYVLARAASPAPGGRYPVVY